MKYGLKEIFITAREDIFKNCIRSFTHKKTPYIEVLIDGPVLNYFTFYNICQNYAML